MLKNQKVFLNLVSVFSVFLFLGLLNYYHRHFQGFADTLEPLTSLLRNGEKWEWQEQEKEQKNILVETNFLIH